MGRRASDVWPWVWFSALAVVIAGPLLGPGHLLLLDYPSGPHLERPSLFPPASANDLGNALPLQALLWLVRRMHASLPDKLLLLLPIVVGGLGVFRFARTRLRTGVWPAVVGGTLFVANPFVLDRFLAGHLHLLLACGLLPWALAPLDRILRPSADDAPSVRAHALAAAAWFAAISVVDLHVAGMYGVLAVIAFAVARRPIAAVIFVAAGAGLVAFWLLSSLLVSPSGTIGEADLAVYASRPEGFGVIPNLLAMEGFWRDELPVTRPVGLTLLVAPLLAVVLVGAIEAFRSPERRKLAVTLSIAGGLGLVLAAGTAFPPTEAVFRWLFDSLPPFRLYREPQKLLGLLLLAYAVFTALGIQALARYTRRSGWPNALGPASLLMVLAYGLPMLWGFGGRVELSRYPSDWARAEAAMEEGGRALILPWHLYAVWSFSDGRIVANPARAYFPREVLAAGETGFEDVPPQSPDPFIRLVDTLVDRREEITEIGGILAPMDVRYVILLHEVDHQTYGFLEGQTDLRPHFRGDALTLWENAAWRPLPVGLPSRSTEEPLIPPVSGGIAPLAWVAGGPAVPPAPEDHVVTGDRCSDGWQLDGRPADCHLGAVAAFESPDRTTEARRPEAGLRALGYLVSAVSLGVVVVLFRRDRTLGRTRSRQSRPTVYSGEETSASAP